MVPAMEALRRLREGNLRFVSDAPGRCAWTSEQRRLELAAGQEPFAVVIGCSDSRAPVEILFDQGPGEIFVIRVAGNIATAPEVGSVEFAAEYFGVRLIVVLGHTSCGAVQATLEELESPSGNLSPNLGSILDYLRASVGEFAAAEPGQDPDVVLQAAIRANIRYTANLLRNESGDLARLVEKEGLLVVGAEYSLETGVVDFFDGLPEAGK